MVGEASIEETGPWWRKPFGMLQTNLREIDADMEVNGVADFIEEYGAKAWLIALLGQRSSGDLILDALEAARSRNLRLLARMDFSKISAQTAAEHPDWCYMSPDGDLQEHTGDLVSVCPCGPYYQERIFDILDEVTRRYPEDGFFVNWTTMNEVDYYKRYRGVCHCSSCRRRWLEYSGRKVLPCGPADANYAQWLAFSRDVVDELTGRIRIFIAARLPSSCLILGKSAEIMFHEANNAVSRELWHHATSEVTSSWASYRADVPVLVNSTAFFDMPYRMAAEDPAHFAQYLLQCIARSGNPSTYLMGPPGRIPYPCLKIGGEITRFHKKWREVYDGLRPCARTALVRPDRAQAAANADFEESLSEFRGLYSAMQELHVPADRYDVVVLANIGGLDTSEVDALDAWVFSGGCLVATGSSGVGVDGAMALKSLPVECERAVVSRRELLWSSYLAAPQAGPDAHTYTGPIIPLYGTYHLFGWRAGAEGRYAALTRAPFSPPEKAYGNVQVNQRGYGAWRFGEGRGVVIPFTVGRGYRETGLGVFRDFFADALREEGNARERLSFSIAEQVEVTVNRNGPRTVVHLVNMSGARRQSFGPHLPISGGRIGGFRDGDTARALVGDKELEVVGGEIVLPTLELFEVIVIENH